MRRKEHMSLVVVLTGLLLFLTVPNSMAWDIVTVDSTGNVGEYTSIAVDDSGKVHISYLDRTNMDLKYAANASGAWVTETVTRPEMWEATRRSPWTAWAMPRSATTMLRTAISSMPPTARAHG